jgi:hypothetical protein
MDPRYGKNYVAGAWRRPGTPIDDWRKPRRKREFMSAALWPFEIDGGLEE